MLQATADVIRFESKRTRTRGRIVLWLAIALAPALLISMLQVQAQGQVPRDAIVLTCYLLTVQVGCMLGLLLWATPVVGAELEAQTWIYIAMRQHAKVALVIGKFLVAAIWTATACIFSSIWVSVASQNAEVDALQLFVCLMTLSCLASFCYAALYTLIGVAIQARATVVAVVYTLMVEGVLSNVPATISKFTVSYRLRSILGEWLGVVLFDPQLQELFPSEPIWQHIAWLILYAAITLTLSLWLVYFKEFPTSSDS